MEKISAILTAYNYAHYLPDALNCLLGQTFPLHQIIVVDDGSTDNTAEVAKGILEAAWRGDPQKRLTPIPQRHYIYQSNQGLPVARNTGISASEGDYILILDADDMIALDFTAKCMALLRRNPHLSGAYTWQKWFGTPEFSLGQVHKNPPWNFRGLLGGNFMNDCSLYKRQVWEDVCRSNGQGYDAVSTAPADGYDPQMWGWCGWEFYIHAGKLGHVWGLLPEPLYWWRRGHGTEEKPTLGGKAWGRQRELLAKIHAKHRELYQ